jgi:CRP-like cAMP-binding protein
LSSKGSHRPSPPGSRQHANFAKGFVYDLFLRCNLNFKLKTRSHKMLEVAVPKSQLHGMDIPSPGKSSAKSAIKAGSLSVPKLDLSLVAHGERIRLHPNSVRMLLSDDLAPQEKDIIKGPGSWSRVLEPLLTKHVSDALVSDVTKICATVNLIPGQFLLRQGLQSKSIFIVVSGTFRLISLGAPGIEPMDSSRAKSARRSFAARQEAQTFGALIDPPESNKPSPSFASQVPCFRVATVGPGQLLGEDCFSAQRIIQFSVMSESYATVLSIPIDSLLTLLSNERYLALSTMCLNTLAHRSQRGVAGGSWYLSKRTELQGLKHTDHSIAMIGTSLQTAIKTAKPDEMHNVEDSSILNSVAPAYPIATSTEGRKIVQEQLMVCVVSASVNKSSRFPQVSASSNGRRAISAGRTESDGLRDVEFASIAAHPDTNIPSAPPDTTKHSESFSRPWASHRSHTARCHNSLEMGQLVHPSQSQSGHSVSWDKASFLVDF